MSPLLYALTLVAALGSATVGGAFFPFSTFVMQALRRLPPAQGAAAMQQINVTAPRPPLMVAMFGTALLSVTLVVVAASSWDEAYAPWLLVGGVVYIAGTVVPTAGYHVPRNNAWLRSTRRIRPRLTTGSATSASGPR